MSNQPVVFLRRVLLADAASCAGMGLAMLLLAGPLDPLLNLPATFISEVGWLLLPCAAFIAYLASRRAPPRIGVWVVIALNVVWVVGSFALLFTDWVSPNAFGKAFVVAQALFVALLAELEYSGLRTPAVATA